MENGIELCRQTRNTTISDLPKEILIEVLTWLPVESVFSCRCVSKVWCSLLSSSNAHFTKLHFSRSPVQLICHAPSIPNVCFHYVELDDRMRRLDNNSVKVFPLRYELPGFLLFSCNGFLLLAADSYLLNPVMIFNPITREYLTLPISEMDDEINRRVVCGFGFSAKSNKYKVVRLVNRGKRKPPSRKSSAGRMVEIYTFGTDSWRSIGTAPKNPEQSFSSCSAFLNGVMHWVCDDRHGSDYIVTFDFESEKFGTLPPPPYFNLEPISERNKIMIGVLGEFLYLSYNLDLWVMREYGLQDSWTKVYAIDGLPLGSLQALRKLSGGKVLMKYREQHHFDDHIITYDPEENSCKEFGVFSQLWSFSAIAHVPNFTSFTAAMM